MTYVDMYGDFISRRINAGDRACKTGPGANVPPFKYNDCQIMQFGPGLSDLFQRRCLECDSVYHHTHDLRHVFTTIEYNSHLT